jgi:hypothetical protein
MPRAFYRVVAIGSLSFYGLLFALNLIFVAFRIDPFYTMLETWSDLALLPFFLIVALFGIGLILLWFGMISDCASTSKMRVWRKVAWLLLLIPTTGIGAWIYYFCIYRKRPSGNPLAQD